MNLASLQQNTLLKIEPALEAFLESQEFNSSRVLKEMIAYHMGWRDANGKGKRIRPFLTLLFAGALQADLETAMPAAIAIEFLHNFTLIHDDIEDQSPLRHGRQTLWQRWGVAHAINAGDALFSIAQLAMLDLTQTCRNEIVLQAAERFNQVCLLLTRGQYLDIAFESDINLDLEIYLEMIRGKTATLIGFSTEMGGLIADQDQINVKWLFDFGESLGMAFQIKDDFLGTWGDPQVTGKSAASDISARKKTLPILYGLRESPEFQSLWTLETLTPNQIKYMASLLESCGAQQYVNDHAEKYTLNAFKILDKVFPESSSNNIYVEALYKLCGDLLNREI